VKLTAGLITRIVNTISPPLNEALRASEALMAPQLDAGCKASAGPSPKPATDRHD
jgi:hypothetical protein